VLDAPIVVTRDLQPAGPAFQSQDLQGWLTQRECDELGPVSTVVHLCLLAVTNHWPKVEGMAYGVDPVPVAIRTHLNPHALAATMLALHERG
jgi:hypothetical protein